MAAVCCPMNSLEAKQKSSRLISWAEISKQPNIDSVIWLSIISLTHFLNEKEHLEKKEIQNIQLKQEKSTRKVYVGAKAMVKEMKRSKRGWYGMQQREGCLQDKIPQAAKFTTCTKEIPMKFSAPKK